MRRVEHRRAPRRRRYRRNPSGGVLMPMKRGAATIGGLVANGLAIAADKLPISKTWQDVSAVLSIQTASIGLAFVSEAVALGAQGVFGAEAFNRIRAQIAMRSADTAKAAAAPQGAAKSLTGMGRIHAIGQGMGRMHVVNGRAMPVGVAR